MALHRSRRGPGDRPDVQEISRSFEQLSTQRRRRRPHREEIGRKKHPGKVLPGLNVSGRGINRSDRTVTSVHFAVASLEKLERYGE